jgi:transposase
MRKGFDSLSGIVLQQMNLSVLNGDIFIFFNRKRNQVKLLLFEGDGFALYHKRLEKGTYEITAGDHEHTSMAVSSQQLQLILQGISLKTVRLRKRYQHTAQSCG